MSEEDQQAQLDEFIARADAWSAETVAQISPDEIQPDTDLGNASGVGSTNDYFKEWPKHYLSSVMVVLRPEGARTPTQVADDLDPWLETQGWVRNTGTEFPPRDDYVERRYAQDGYGLTVRAYTEPLPQAQAVVITIVTPKTDVNRG